MLKDLDARYASKRATDYTLADGEGLNLLVRPNGSKLWRMKYRFGGPEKLLSFGAYPGVTLAAARQKRAGARPERASATRSAMSFERAARALARHALAGSVLSTVGTATHCHTDWIVPWWSASLGKIALVEGHIFYRPRASYRSPANGGQDRGRARSGTAAR